MKKFLVWWVLILLLVLPAHAWLKQRHYFFNEENQAITNVKVVAWPCTKADCSTVDTTRYLSYYEGGQVKSLSSNGATPNTAYIDILYPDNLMTTHGYLILFFHSNYLSKNKPKVTWNYVGNPTQFYNLADYYISPTGPIGPFRKTQPPPCKAPSSLIVQNKIGEWLPLTIDTTSQLDSETGTNIHPYTTVYLPTSDPSFANYFKVATTISLQIKDKKTNSIVYSQSSNLMIPWDSSLPTSFAWSPTDSSYVPGNYTVNLTSHVTDTKCSSVIDDTKTQDIEVFPELPDDACIITAEPVSLQSPVSKGQPGNLNVTSYYYYLDKSYDSDYELHLTYTGITANYKLTFTNTSPKIDKILTGTFPVSFSSARTDTAPAKPMNTVAWTPLTYGDYDVKLELTSTDPLCLNKQNDFSRGTRADTVTIVVRDMDNDGATEAVDCNDNNPNIKPGKDDTTCDGIDQNCG